MRSLPVLACLLGSLACVPREPAPEPESGPRDERSAPPASAPAARTWGFDDAPPGPVPAGVTIGETNPHNHPATWAVVARDDAPSAPHAFGVTACDNPKGATFEVALLDDTRYRDLDAELWMLAVAGEHDQGGGLVWRARDVDNYYVARWNPIEGNLRFYVVVDSERRQLAELALTLEPDKWHRMHLTVEERRFMVTMDDGETLSIEDDTLTEPGRIGLWTKSDAKTLFDELTLTAP